jgi:alpha-galactosidase/6-phospho-beta-glucosidase family protein
MIRECGRATEYRQAALQCLLLDPVVTDLEVAQQILDDYLETYRDYLPQFW